MVSVSPGLTLTCVRPERLPLCCEPPAPWQTCPGNKGKSTTSIRLFGLWAAEPPLDRHMPVFTSKYFRCTGKKYSCRYYVPAENKSALCDFLSQNDFLLPVRWPLLLCSPSSRLFTSKQNNNLCYWGSREKTCTLLGLGSVTVPADWGLVPKKNYIAGTAYR